MKVEQWKKKARDEDEVSREELVGGPKFD